MQRRTAGVLGAIAAIAAAPVAGATTTPANNSAVPVASSYAELLQPIPNATERLKLADAEASERPAVLIKAQYYAHHHHHHHHHYRYIRRVRPGYYWYGGRWLRNHHHHHHHHHHSHY